mgnify:FL=1
MNGTHTILYFYDGLSICSIQVDGQSYFLRRNLFQDVTHIYDLNGNLVASYLYDAWGNHQVLDANGIENTNADFIGNINPIRYRGYYFDVETNLYYLNSRYYDPEVGRFISLDAVDYLAPDSIHGLNLFAYCFNNPIMYADPSGHIVIGAMLLTGLIMGLSMVVFQGVSDLTIYAQTGNWDHVVWQDYVGNFIGGFVGGALSVVLTSGLATSLVATGISRLVSMKLQNATGNANYSTWDIVKDVGLSMLVTTVTYGLTYGIGNNLSGNNYFKTYSDLPYLLGHGLTKGVEKGVVNQFMYQYVFMTMNMGLIASFGDYVVGYKWKNKLLGVY